MGYCGQGRIAHLQMDLPFLVCGEFRHAKLDICLVDYSKPNILLFAQEDKALKNKKGAPKARAQLVAVSIAAFNNKINSDRKMYGLPPLAEKVSHFVTVSNLFPELVPFR